MDTFIFDLDGTLLDTLDDLMAAVNYALTVHHMPQRSREEVRCFVGNGVQKLVERAVLEGTPHDTTMDVLDTFRQYYLQHAIDRTRPYDGIPEVLNVLKQRGKHVAVVSNKFYRATQELCLHFFPNTVDVAIGEHEAEGIRKKPAPDTVIEALRQLGVGRERSVYIGDSDVDVQTARNSKMPCVSVLWGFRDRDFLLAHGATRFVERPEELLEL